MVNIKTFKGTCEEDPPPGMMSAMLQTEQQNVALLILKMLGWKMSTQVQQVGESSVFSHVKCFHHLTKPIACPAISSGPKRQERGRALCPRIEKSADRHEREPFAGGPSLKMVYARAQPG